MIVTCWDHSMTNNQGREIFSTIQETSICPSAVPLSWVSPAQVCWLSLWAAHIPGSSHLTPVPTSAAGDALFSFTPDPIKSVSAGARGAQGRHSHTGVTPNPIGRYGRCRLKCLPLLKQASSHCKKMNVIALCKAVIICKYECYNNTVHFPSMFTHPDLWRSARDLSGAEPGIACRWKLYQRNVSSISPTKNLRKSKWEEV